MWGGDLEGRQQQTKQRGKEGLRQPEKGVHRTEAAGAMVDMTAAQSRHSRTGQTKSGSCSHSRAGQTKSGSCGPFKKLSLYVRVMGNH